MFLFANFEIEFDFSHIAIWKREFMEKMLLVPISRFRKICLEMNTPYVRQRRMPTPLNLDQVMVHE